MRQSTPTGPESEPEQRVRSHRRGAAVRDGVMTAAVNELLRVGLDRLTIAQVADRAGVHVTSIYRRWKTKEQLITDALIDHLDPTVPLPDTGSLRGDLVALTTDLHTSLTSPQVKTLLRLATTSVDIEPLSALERRMTEARVAVLRSLFTRAADRGEIEDPAASDYPLILEVIHAPIYARVLLSREPVGPDFIEALIDVLMVGVVPR